MSVESCTPATPKAPAGGHGAKGKSRAAGEAASADASDFSALLMQLGETDADAATGASDELASFTAEGDASKLLAGGEKSATDGAKADPVLLLTQPTPAQHGAQPVDHSLLLAQSMQFQRGAQPVDQPVGISPEGGLAAVAGSVQIEVASSRPLTEGLAPTPAAKGGDVVRPELGEVIKEVAAKASAPHRGAPRAAVAEAATAQQSGVANANANVAAEVLRMQKLAQVEPRVELSSGLAQTQVASAASESGVRRAERTGEKTDYGQGGNREGGWGHQALLATPAAEQSFTMTEPTAVMSPEAMVAEQVNYWVGHDVQNAELKLDGMGDSPVEVSISLQGNEARVEFRTDQLEARQVLEGAVSHLKDLLGNEGLVLSGVSVGSSGAEGAASQEGKPQQNGRQATVAVPQAQPVDMNARTAPRLSGRSVDLFV